MLFLWWPRVRLAVKLAVWITPHPAKNVLIKYLIEYTDALVQVAEEVADEKGLK